MNLCDVYNAKKLLTSCGTVCLSRRRKRKGGRRGEEEGSME
jgi:hypothetical protein